MTRAERTPQRGVPASKFMKTVGIIPARWTSTRFRGKPLFPIAGKPLLRHVWERCQKARSLDGVIIATDDMRIATAAFEWGAEIALTASHHVSGTDRVAEVARLDTKLDYVLNIQGDEPLIDPRLIDRLVAKLRSDRDIGIVTAAHPFTHAADISSPHQVKVVIDLKGRALYFSRSPVPYLRAPTRPQKLLRHQGIYGFRRETLLQFVRWKPSPLERAESLEQLRALENGVTVHVLVTKQGSPGVDTRKEAAALEQKLTRAQSRRAAK
jgi:3-deoxy-manno-octulosonate cytidylyltransferase (CMP-KDO synthetase)